MEVARHTYYVFDLNEHAFLLSFVWTEKSAAMTVRDYKDAMREYARLVVQHRVRCALVDLRKFQYRAQDTVALGSWWAEEIVPLYNQARSAEVRFCAARRRACTAERKAG